MRPGAQTGLHTLISPRSRVAAQDLLYTAAVTDLVVARYRFRPAHPGVAGLAALLGGGLLAGGLLAGSGAAVLILGGFGLAMAALYFASPVWRTEVRTDETGLEVLTRGDRRFRLGWADVVRVVAAPRSKSAFLDGGEPQRSLLLPGPGARAPYRIENQASLFQEVMERTPPDRVIEVDRLSRAAASLSLPDEK